MELIRKVISVIILPHVVSLCLGMSLSLNPFYLFSFGWSSLQGEYLIGEELSSVPLPVPVPIYHFDEAGGKGENDGKEEMKELKCYSRRKKQEGVQERGQDLLFHEPHQDYTSEPSPETGNVTIPYSSTSASENLD